MCEVINIYPCLNIIINEYSGAIVYNSERSRVITLAKFSKSLEIVYLTIIEFLKTLENNNLVVYNKMTNNTVDSGFYNKDNFKNEDLEK